MPNDDDDERQYNESRDGRRTDEVDGEAAVGLAAGGAAEEGGAVGRAHDGVEEGAPAERHGVVAGVRVRVAEDEDGVVPPPGCELRRRRRERDGEEEERDGARGERLGGHAGRVQCTDGRGGANTPNALALECDGAATTVSAIRRAGA
jgi:hypothetical protein